MGKTALLQRFGAERTTVFHTGAGRGERDELSLLSRRVAAVAGAGLRDLDTRPYADWDDALDDLATRAADHPLLLVLDEFPELVGSSPPLPGILRAFLDRSEGHTQLRLLLCGSAVRHMQALQEERQPLYGRFDLSLPVYPFEPHEAALMLPGLSGADRALVYGVVGGMPLYLSWWDQAAPINANLARLVCEPGARLLTEGDLVLRTDVDRGDLAHRALYAIANGRTQYNQIKESVRAEPARTLDRLIELRLVERRQPVGGSTHTKRRSYRVSDPFIAFHLGIVDPYRSEIDRGLGSGVVRVLRAALDDHMGGVFEEAFRQHLRLLAARDELPVEGPIVALGPWWDRAGQHEIDAVALAGRSRALCWSERRSGPAPWTPPGSAVRSDARHERAWGPSRRRCAWRWRPGWRSRTCRPEGSRSPQPICSLLAALEVGLALLGESAGAFLGIL